MSTIRNSAHLHNYIQNVSHCKTPTDFTHASWIEKEELSIYEQYNDLIITALRTSDGLDLLHLRKKFGDQLTNYCLKNASKHLNNGLLEIIKEKEQYPEGLLKLTRQGIFVSDGVMSDLLFIED